ncbi:hypothetical protein E2562_007113 [Oryza meyeriana var. granulata]|uniref:F-box domain-containing protein n=1 Tax=Oryza meyeriana var. granulata TaxID=110450 RepID=A0A6G1F4T6_9ORYZ|nr:hypothetical protein E2562_007113 [Oryza meyeriana var. granulata]
MEIPKRHKHRRTRHKHHRRINPPPPSPPPPAAVAIPDDVFFSHILVNLPVKSLVRFKAVCRSWHAAIDDPALVRRHLELSRERQHLSSLLAIASAEDIWENVWNDVLSENISFHRVRRLALGARAAQPEVEIDLMLEKFSPGHIAHRILPTHCDGLVAFATSAGPVSICNPATQEFVVLPPGSGDNFRQSAAAIGFDLWRNRYVVARSTTSGTRFMLGGGAGDGWQPTRDPPRPTSPGQGPACTRNGAVYWFIYDWLEPCALLRFNL